MKGKVLERPKAGDIRRRFAGPIHSGIVPARDRLKDQLKDIKNAYEDHDRKNHRPNCFITLRVSGLIDVVVTVVFHDRLTFPVVAVAFPLFQFLPLQLLETRNMLLCGVGPCCLSAALRGFLVLVYPILQTICSLYC